MTDKIYGKHYVGYTELILKKRIYSHKSDSKRQNNKMSKIIREIGIENFIVDILYITNNKEEADRLEDEIGKHHNLESKEKISIGNTGKILSKETKIKIGLKSIGRNSGEKSPTSKLKDKEALEIRELYKNGIKQKYLAKKYNVSIPNISNIVNRKTFIHI